MGPWKWGRGPGKGRVGRRIVYSFLLFALVPLLAFAWLSHGRVVTELEQGAAEQLQQDVKSASVLLTDRLILAANELVYRGTEEGEGLDENMAYIARRAIVEIRDAAEVGLLDDDIRAGLDDRGVVLRVRYGAGGWSAWLIVNRQGRADPVAGRVDSDVLFEPDGLVRPPASFSAHLVDGSLLHASGVAPPTVEDLRIGGVGTATRGELLWGEGDAERLGAFRVAFLEPQFGLNLVVVFHHSHAQVLSPVHGFQRDFVKVVLLTAFLVILASLVRIRRILRPVSELVRATARVARQDFGVRLETLGNDEFAALGGAFNTMAQDLQHRAEVMAAVNEFGSSLSVEGDPRALLRTLLLGAARMFRVDGVMIHAVDDAGRLDVRQFRIHSLDLDTPDMEAGEQEWPPVLPSRSTIEGSAPRDATDMEASARWALKALADEHEYEVRDTAVLPMRDHEGGVIGALTLFNPEDAEGRAVAMDEATVELAASLAGQAAVALHNARLRHEFKGLFDAMIQMLAVAVDEKSEYTGGHCRRVPRLAMMILDEIQASDSVPFANVSFGPDEVYEMQVASLLHDCGKVVTPVHVIDKATKLETIWDRIRLADQRFETAVREREATELRRAATNAGVDLTEVEERIHESIRRMQDDRAFLRLVNVGDEHMSDADVERVETIARTWVWHDADGTEKPLLTEDEEHNLCIRRGTLNEDERQIIRYHMHATLKMLDQLPFPSRMSNVPLIAGSHHEQLNGKGYPRGLQGDEIPLRGRVLAIADIFEALTATDRPYKPGKTAVEALEILAGLVREGALDADVFDLFLETRVWERYAAELSLAGSSDAVDPEAIQAIQAIYRRGRRDALTVAH